MRRIVSVLALVAAFTVALGSGAQAADRGKVARFWERQLHTGGVIQLLDYRILRCGPRACIVRWHFRAFIRGTGRTSPASTSTSGTTPAIPTCACHAIGAP
jgi:hypothetical protein